MNSDFKFSYETDGIKFTSKVAALDYSFRYRTKEVQAKLYSDGFEKVDWKKEPVETFDELCKQRAQQLRDNIQKLVIFYSGGSDSTHLINVFVKNNIKIDEIVLIRDNNFNFHNNPHPVNWEIDNFAIPYLKQINPSCKITLFEPKLTEEKLKYYFSEEAQFEYNISKGFDITSLYWQEVSKVYDSFVDGSCEPRVYVEDNKFFAEIWDGDNFFVRTRLVNNFNFYTDPLFPSLHLKQCHLMKNYMIENNITHNMDLDEYKKIIVKTVRKLSFDTSTSPFFSKYGFLCPKTVAWTRNLASSNPYLALRYKEMLQFKVNGYLIRKLPIGIRILRKEM